MINWVLQLNNSQLENSFNSLLEKHHVSKLSKPTQSKPNPICDRSGKPEDTERVFVDKGKTFRLQEIDDKRLHKELGSLDRTGKLVKLSEDIRVMHTHYGTGEPVKSSASTHIVKEQFVPAEHTVKRSHGVNVHNLIQKIESHPQQQALQSDLQQHRPFNPFSEESQK